MRPITKADAVLEAKVMRLGRTLAFCTCEIREAGGAKPAAFSTGTYAILVSCDWPGTRRAGGGLVADFPYALGVAVSRRFDCAAVNARAPGAPRTGLQSRQLAESEAMVPRGGIEPPTP